MTPARFRQLALELPDVTEEAHAYGTYYRLRGHQIAAISADQRTVLLIVTPETARARKKLDPGFNVRVGRLRKSPPAAGLLIHLPSLSDDEARELLREALPLVPQAWLSPPDYHDGRRNY